MSTQYRSKLNTDTFLLTMACGATIETAAQLAGISIRTAYRRLDDPAIKLRLIELRSQIVDRASGALTAASGEAVRTLLDLIKPAVAPTVRLGAARAILEIGMKIREIAELERRLTELEVRLAEAEERKSEKW